MCNRTLFTFVGVLNACASIGALEESKCAHAEIIQSGCESNVFVRSSLINMYAKCGSMDDVGACMHLIILEMEHE